MARHSFTLSLLLSAARAAEKPFVQSQAPILPPFPVTSLLVSADGSTLAMLGSAGAGVPSAALYVRSPVDWSLQQVLQGISGPALAGDGTTIAAMPTAPSAGPTVYTRTGLVWTQSQVLSTPWAPTTVVIALAFLDNATLAVSLKTASPVPPFMAIQLFALARNGTWLPTESFPIADQPRAMGLAAGNNTIASSSTVPAPGSSQFSVAVTKRGTDGTWDAPGAYVTARDGASDGGVFGAAPQLSADGRTLLAASSGTPCARPYVSIFTRGFADWSLVGALFPVDGYLGDPFSTAVALASDGQVVATAGTANASVATCGLNGYATTRVTVYARDGAGSWSSLQRVIADILPGAPTPCVAAVGLAVAPNTGAARGVSALFIATTYTNATAAPVLVYAATAGPTAARGIPPPAPLVVFSEAQQVYTPCCCSLVTSFDGATLVSSTTTSPQLPAAQVCVSTFSRVETSWVLDSVLQGFAAPALTDDGSLLAALNFTSGAPAASGVTVFSGPEWSLTAQLPLPPGTVLGVDFLSSSFLAVAVWLPTPPPPCTAGSLNVIIFALETGWVVDSTLTPSGCPFNPSQYALFSPVVRASATSIIVSSAWLSTGLPSPEGVVLSWTRGSTNGTWFTAGDGGTGDSFGAAANFSPDGSMVAIGAPASPMPAKAQCPSRAAAYLFSTTDSRQQSWSQVAKLTPPDGFAGDLAGASVALSRNGHMALMSSNPSGVSCASQAYVYQRAGAADWRMTQRLFPAAASAPCIASVALTFDGEYAFVGTFNRTATPRGLTPIIAFTSGLVPTPTPSPTPPPPPPPAYPAFAPQQSLYAPCCCDLVVAGDGLTMVASGTTPQCSAIYTRAAETEGSNWTLQQVLPGVVWAVVNHDASILMGAQNPAVPPFVPPTTVIVYEKSGLVYQPAQIGPQSVANGTIVDLGFLDGETFAIATWSGASPPPAPCAAAGQLHAYLVDITATSYTLRRDLTPTDCPIPLPLNPAIGTAPMSMATAPGLVAVGMATQLAPSGVQGVTYLWARAGPDSWVQTEITATDGSGGDGFGTSLAFAPTVGDPWPMLVAGAPRDLSSRGTAYAFSINNAGLWEQSQRLAASNNLNGDQFGVTVAVSAGGTTLVAASVAPLSAPRVNCTSQVYVYALDNGPGAWVEQQIVTRSENTACVLDVAVTPDGATVFVATQSTAQGISVFASRVLLSASPSASVSASASPSPSSTSA